jgi:P-type Cu2+ transporter
MSMVMSKQMKPPFPSEQICLHCNQKFNAPETTTTQNSDSHHASGEQFCCKGCYQSYKLIHSLNLDSYYAMSQVTQTKRDFDTNEPEDFEIFDAPSFQKTFVQQKESQLAEVFIEGIHCYACVWLIREACQRQFKGSVRVEINQATQAAQIHWQANTKLSDIVRFIHALGYKVHPDRARLTGQDQKELVKVGVGLFIMVNVMSFALVEYFTGADGVDQTMLWYMRVISALLATVSMAWPGRSFFIATKRSVVARQISIDGPILIGLIGAYLYSLYNTAIMGAYVYFDSITAVVALVTTGRYIQTMVLRTHQARLSSLIKARNGFVLVKRNNSFDFIPATEVVKGDTVRFLPGDLLPFRTVCQTNCAVLSLAELNGEPIWKTVNVREVIPAGATNGQSAILAVADENGTDSYTASLEGLVNKAMFERGHFQAWADRAAWYLFSIVMIVVVSNAAYQIWLGDINAAIARSVSTLLVACPCTFAIGVPLIFATTMSRMLAGGVLFKSQKNLEALAKVNTAIFDKTGTLTIGEPGVKAMQDLLTDRENHTLIYASILAAKDLSSHHTLKSLCRWVLQQKDAARVIPAYTVEDFLEIPGRGVSFTFKIDSTHHKVKIGSPLWLAAEEVRSIDSLNDNVAVAISMDGRVLVGFSLDDAVRPDSWSLVRGLKDLGLKIGILSGDQRQRTLNVAAQLKIPLDQVYYEASPLQKSKLIAKTQNSATTVMIGNGLNDSVAMARAAVGISVAKASTPAQSSSDICLLDDRLALIEHAIIASRYATKRMKIVFGFATFYNTIGLVLAATGHMSPLMAAILMPLSSLTITKLSIHWPKQFEDWTQPKMEISPTTSQNTTYKESHQWQPSMS